VLFEAAEQAPQAAQPVQRRSGCSGAAGAAAQPVQRRKTHKDQPTLWPEIAAKMRHQLYPAKKSFLVLFAFSAAGYLQFHY
jgi:hypothetical protein